MLTLKWKEKEERKTMQTFKIFFGKEVLQSAQLLKFENFIRLQIIVPSMF